MTTRRHLQDLGLPGYGVSEISSTPLHSWDSFPFAKAGSGANSARLYAPVEGYNLGSTHFASFGTLGYLMSKYFVECDFFLHASTS
jgi:hypothetical protein